MEIDINILIELLKDCRVQQDCKYELKDKNTVLISGIIYEPHLYHILKVVKKNKFHIFMISSGLMIYK